MKFSFMIFFFLQIIFIKIHIKRQDPFLLGNCVLFVTKINNDIGKKTVEVKNVKIVNIMNNGFFVLLRKKKFYLFVTRNSKNEKERKRRRSRRRRRKIKRKRRKDRFGRK